MPEPHAEPDIHDMVVELTRGHVHRERYTVTDVGRSRHHITRVPALITQLVGVTNNTTGSRESTGAVKELVAHGFWIDLGSRYEVVHHADVVQDSLEAQQAKRDRDKAAQRRLREKKAEKAGSAPPEPDVSGDVSADPRQTDRQTDKPLGEPMKTKCIHGNDVRFWDCPECKERASA